MQFSVGMKVKVKGRDYFDSENYRGGEPPDRKYWDQVGVIIKVENDGEEYPYRIRFTEDSEYPNKESTFDENEIESIQIELDNEKIWCYGIDYKH